MQPKLHSTARGLAILPFIFLSMAVCADTACPGAEARDANGTHIAFQQHTFADGSTDLVLVPQSGSDTDAKRVTYGGGKTEGCLYQSVAMAAGGGANQWGWHLAWAGAEGVRYARMDGEAWVSSPPKRLGSANAREVEFETKGSELVLRWREQHGDREVTYQAVSQDEGRSWDQPQPMHPDH